MTKTEFVERLIKSLQQGGRKFKFLCVEIARAHARDEMTIEDAKELSALMAAHRPSKGSSFAKCEFWTNSQHSAWWEHSSAQEDVDYVHQEKARFLREVILPLLKK